MDLLDKSIEKVQDAVDNFYDTRQQIRNDDASDTRDLDFIMDGDRFKPVITDDETSALDILLKEIASWTVED